LLRLLEGRGGDAKVGLEKLDDAGRAVSYEALPMPPDETTASEPDPILFRPSPRALLILVPLALAALGLALFLRYDVVQNTPVGLACEAGERSFTCGIRLAAILLFARGAFGWTAVAAALVQLCRPNILAFGIGVVAAAFGLVLYNTRLSALAVALLVLSLARAAPKAR
jgi:hypothetical protein